MALIDRSITAGTAATIGKELSSVLIDIKKYAWKFFIDNQSSTIVTLPVKFWIINTHVDVKLSYLTILFVTIFGPNTWWNDDGTAKVVIDSNTAKSTSTIDSADLGGSGFSVAS